MKKMTKLDIGRVDLSEIAHALEDHSGETSWYLDPKSGELHMSSFGMWDGQDVDEAFEPPAHLRRVDSLDSRESYSDLADFTERVRDPRTRELLERAIAGRGAFRRFKDTLSQFPDLRTAWFAFHDTRMERRVVEWLLDGELISDEEAERALAARPDPVVPGIEGAFDARRIARDVAADLRGVFGQRLRQVVLFGSWARGDAHPESDIDLLVVLDRADDRWAEHKRMRDVLWRHSLENDTVVSTLVVDEADYKHALRPVLMRIRAEGEVVE